MEENELADFECNLVSFITKNYYPKKDQDVEHIFPFIMSDKNGERIISLDHTYKVHQNLKPVLEYKSKAEINTHFKTRQAIAPIQVADIIRQVLEVSKQIFEKISEEQVKQKFTFDTPTIQEIIKRINENIIGRN